MWGSTPKERRLHLVNWNAVTFPKEHSRLDLHESRPINLTLLTKLNWRLLSKAKCLTNNPNSNPWSPKGAYYRTWAACKAAKPLLDAGLRKLITSGTNTSFWFDKWSSIGTLRSHLHRPLNLSEKHQLVYHMTDNNGN